MASDDDTQASANLDLLEVLWAHLGRRTDSGDSSTGRLEALRVLRARRLRGAQDLDPDIAALFGLIAVEPSELGTLTPGIAAFLQRDVMQGLDRDAIPAIFQAYVRGVGRIVGAEAEIARDLLADQSPEDQRRILDETLEGLVPLASRGFEVLHRMLLLGALAEALTGGEEASRSSDPMAIAMVDIVGSTRYLVERGPLELKRLVDALFQTGQAATAQRPVQVLKYVGDGLFMSGRDAGEVADAALDVVTHLEETLPLRARSGLAWGPVVQRAGDVFGLPINIAHIATKAARPGTLLATAEAAARLPSSRRGRYRTVGAAHPALGQMRVATVLRGAGAGSP